MFKQYREFQPGEYIIVGADCSEGCGDNSCAQFYSKGKMDVPLVWCSPAIATEMTNAIYPILEKIYDVTGIKPLVAYERNKGGTYEVERLSSLNRMSKYEIYIMPDDIGKEKNGESKKKTNRRLGWETNGASRPAMLIALKEAIDDKVIKVYDLATLEELLTFIKVQSSGTWKAAAEKNCHDDRVMALAIAYQVALCAETVNLRKKSSGYKDRERSGNYDMNPMTV